MDEQLAQEVMEGGIRRASLLESVDLQLSRAKEELARLTELKQLLEINPETQRILELLGRGRKW